MSLEDDYLLKKKEQAEEEVQVVMISLDVQSGDQSPKRSPRQSSATEVVSENPFKPISEKDLVSVLKSSEKPAEELEAG